MRNLILLICVLGLSFNAYSQKHKKEKQKTQVTDSTGVTVTEKDTKKSKSKKKSNWDAKKRRSDQQAWDSLPDPIGLTNDFEKVFTDSQVVRLDSLIAEFEKKTKIEIAVITVDSASINGEFFNDLAPLVAKTWGIGKEKEMNGIVLAVSVSYRRADFFLDTGINQYLSDGEAKDIVKKFVFPHFKQEKYFDGVWAGITELMKVIDSRSVEITK
jgi:uncharacterized protein